VDNDFGAILGRISLQLQILDIVMNKPFMNHLKLLNSEWLHGKGPCSDTKWGKKEAHVRTSLPVDEDNGSDGEGFKTCFVFNAVEGT
jgi:hypothetical protein